jgi:hypothetical protein
MNKLNYDELNVLEEALRTLLDKQPHNSKRRKIIKALADKVVMQQCSIACG